MFAVERRDSLGLTRNCGFETTVVIVGTCFVLLIPRTEMDFLNSLGPPIHPSCIFCLQIQRQIHTKSFLGSDHSLYFSMVLL